MPLCGGVRGRGCTTTSLSTACPVCYTFVVLCSTAGAVVVRRSCGNVHNSTWLLTNLAAHAASVLCPFQLQSFDVRACAPQTSRRSRPRMGGRRTPASKSTTPCWLPACAKADSPCTIFRSNPTTVMPRGVTMAPCAVLPPREPGCRTTAVAANINPISFSASEGKPA